MAVLELRQSVNRVLDFKFIGNLSVGIVTSLLCLIIVIIVFRNPQWREKRFIIAAICLGWAAVNLAPKMDDFLVGVTKSLPEAVKVILVRTLFLLGIVSGFEVVGGLTVQIISYLVCLVIAIIILRNPQQREKKPVLAATCLAWGVGGLALELYSFLVR